MRRTLIGLTGSMGAGKTTVARVFHRLGARVIDADKVAKEFLNKRKPEYRKIVQVFGPAILGKNGAISRSKLATLVFVSPKLLRKLNGIVHPAVLKKVMRLAAGSKRPVVIEAALLMEAGWSDLFDTLVVVTAPLSRRLLWLKKRGFSQAEARLRMKNQWTQAKKAARADIILSNSTTKKALENKVKALWSRLVTGKK